jgi:hypothetical protein
MADRCMKHPTLMTSQERLRIADKLLRDDCDELTRKAAADIIYMQEAILTSTRKALQILD